MKHIIIIIYTWLKTVVNIDFHYSKQPIFQTGMVFKRWAKRFFCN